MIAVYNILEAVLKVARVVHPGVHGGADRWVVVLVGEGEGCQLTIRGHSNIISHLL